MVRKLGIRHVVVVNIKNEVVGMITRKNLVTLEAENHSHKQSTLKQKPLFYKAKMKGAEPIGVQKCWEKCTNQFGGGINVNMDSSGRVRFDQNTRAFSVDEDGLMHRSRVRSTAHQSNVSAQSDVSSVHIPYESI